MSIIYHRNECFPSIMLQMCVFVVRVILTCFYNQRRADFSVLTLSLSYIEKKKKRKKKALVPFLYNCIGTRSYESSIARVCVFGRYLYKLVFRIQGWLVMISRYNMCSKSLSVVLEQVIQIAGKLKGFSCTCQFFFWIEKGLDFDSLITGRFLKI